MDAKDWFTASCKENNVGGLGRGICEVDANGSKRVLSTDTGSEAHVLNKRPCVPASSDTGVKAEPDLVCLECPQTQSTTSLGIKGESTCVQGNPSGTKSGPEADQCIIIDDDDWDLHVSLNTPEATSPGTPTPPVEPTYTLSADGELTADRIAIAEMLYKRCVGGNEDDVLPRENEPLQSYFVRACNLSKKNGVSALTYACIGHAATLARNKNKTNWYVSITGQPITTNGTELIKARSAWLFFGILDDLVRNFRLPNEVGKVLLKRVRLLHPNHVFWKKKDCDPIMRYFAADLSRDKIVLRLDQLLQIVPGRWAAEVNKKLQTKHWAGTLVWGRPLCEGIFENQPWPKWKEGIFHPLEPFRGSTIIPHLRPPTMIAPSTDTSYPFISPTNQVLPVERDPHTVGHSTPGDPTNQNAPLATFLQNGQATNQNASLATFLQNGQATIQNAPPATFLQYGQATNQNAPLATFSQNGQATNQNAPLATFLPSGQSTNQNAQNTTFLTHNQSTNLLAQFTNVTPNGLLSGCITNQNTQSTSLLPNDPSAPSTTFFPYGSPPNQTAAIQTMAGDISYLYAANQMAQIATTMGGFATLPVAHMAGQTQPSDVFAASHALHMLTAQTNHLHQAFLMATQQQPSPTHPSYSWTDTNGPRARVATKPAARQLNRRASVTTQPADINAPQAPAGPKPPARQLKRRASVTTQPMGIISPQTPAASKPRTGLENSSATTQPVGASGPRPPAATKQAGRQLDRRASVTTQPPMAKPSTTNPPEVIEIPDSPPPVDASSTKAEQVPCENQAIEPPFQEEIIEYPSEEEIIEPPSTPTSTAYSNLAEAILTETSPAAPPDVKSEQKSSPSATESTIKSEKGDKDPQGKMTTEQKEKQPAPAWWMQYMR